MIWWGLVFLTIFVTQIFLHMALKDKEASKESLNQQSLTLTDYAALGFVAGVSTFALMVWSGALTP